MRFPSRIWLILPLAGLFLCLALAIPAIGSARYEKSMQAHDGYGDFYTLFVGAEDSTRATKAAATPSFDMTSPEKEPLAWAIKEDRLPPAFTWLSVTLDQGTRAVLRVIEAMAVTSLIPAGVLLVGTSTLCLIGIRRKDRSKA